MNLKKRGLSGVKWTSLSAIANSVTIITQTAILAHILTPEDFGLMGMILVIVNISLLFSDFGISSAIIHHQEVSKDQLSTLYWINIFSGMIVSLTVYALSPVIATLFNEPNLISLIHKISIVFFICSIGQQFDSLLRKEMKFDLISKISISAYIIAFLSTITLALLHFGVESLVYGHIILISTRSFAIVFLCWNRWQPKLTFVCSEISYFLNFGIFQMGEKITNSLNMHAPQIIIGSTLGTEALGFYTLAYEYAFRPTLVIHPIINKVTFPLMATIQHQIKKSQKIYTTVTNLLSFVTFPLMFGLAFISPVAITFLYGDQWAESIKIAQLIAIIAAMRSIISPTGPLVLAHGRVRRGFLWTLARLAAHFPILYICAEIGGLTAMLFSYLALQLLIFILSYYIIIKPILGLRHIDHLKSIFPSLACSLLMILLLQSTNLLIDFTAFSSIAYLTIFILLGVLFYIITSLIFNRNSFFYYWNLLSNIKQ